VQHVVQKIILLQLQTTGCDSR